MGLSRIFRHACPLVFAVLLPVSGGAIAATPRTVTRAPKAEGTKLPANVDVYASVKLGGGWRCEVGAEQVGDLLREVPVVYLGKPGHGFAWHARLRIPEHFYQGRATHCVASGGRVYVLVQLDTDSRRSMNETVLRVAALNEKTGARITSRSVEIPEVSSSFYTSWVKEGRDHFRLKGNRLVISGEYELMSDRNSGSGKAPTAFVVELPTPLRR